MRRVRTHVIDFDCGASGQLSLHTEIPRLSFGRAVMLVEKNWRDTGSVGNRRRRGLCPWNSDILKQITWENLGVLLKRNVAARISDEVTKHTVVEDTVTRSNRHLSRLPWIPRNSHTRFKIFVKIVK